MADLDSIKAEAASLVARTLRKGIGTRPTAAPPPPPPTPLPDRLVSPVMEWRSITPEAAKEWLATRNKGNRPLRGSTVDAYARDMAAGDWRKTHQGIAFDTDGQLLDGQHRLAAIVKARATIDLCVTWNLPREKEKRVGTVDAIDRGASRSVGDVLKLNHGEDNAGAVSAIAIAVARICLCGERQVKRATVGQVLGILEVFGDSIRPTVTRSRQTNLRNLRSAAILGPIAFVGAVDPATAASFHGRLNTGTELAEDSPVLRLRNFCLGDKFKGWNRGHGPERQRAFETVLRCLELYAKRKPMPGNLTWSKEGLYSWLARQPDRVARIEALMR